MKPAADWARELGIPTAAVELYRESDVIDLHVDSFIWQRTLGYDLTKRHRAPLWGAFLGQVDFPRILEAEISGATWVITTNPMREPADRTLRAHSTIDTLPRGAAGVSVALSRSGTFPSPSNRVLATDCTDYTDHFKSRHGLHGTHGSLQVTPRLHGTHGSIQVPRELHEAQASCDRWSGSGGETHASVRN